MFLGRISHTSQRLKKELAEPVFMDQTVRSWLRVREELLHKAEQQTTQSLKTQVSGPPSKG